MRRAPLLTVLLVMALAAAPAGATDPNGAAAPAAATDPSGAAELAPVLHAATEPGRWRAEPAGSGAVAARTVDGGIADWTGTSPRLSGTSLYSDGELVYTDHLFDAHGPDNGVDADRVATLGPAESALPQTYRVEPLVQQNVPGEFGLPNPYPAKEQYGDAGLQARADIVETRVAADETNLYLLVRTSAMTTPADTAVLVLLDTEPGSAPRAVPFSSGLETARAEVAVLVADGAGKAIDLRTGAETPVAAVAQPAGFTNAVEAAIPRALVGAADPAIAIAAGLFDAGTGSLKTLTGLNANIANVAFRHQEPVRVWFDREQALALFRRSIDPFFASIDLQKMTSGARERLIAGRGYYERVFESTAAISTEGGTEGVFQHYGLYLPDAYDTGGDPVPTTFWFHWRGGKAHSAAAVIPRLMRDMGEGLGGIVVSPRGRGTSTWYLGRGMVDYMEVWNDLTTSFRVDRDRVYVTGHSMGGWASFLMPILYPDRFAASFPVSPPVTQGAWTGLDFPGCDSFRSGDYTPCYIRANDSNPRVQHTRRLLENLRNVPVAIYAGAADELVPIGGVARQAERLQQLGYRHRFYVFPTYEHYTPPVVDEWMEGARYFAAAARTRDPARVSYVRDMPFELSVERGPSQVQSPATGLDFHFDRAYWMSELEPADPVTGIARFEGRTLAKPDPSALVVPEAGGPAGVGQTGPFTMAGLTWLQSPLPTSVAANGFEATLTGAVRVRLDLTRMGLESSAPITATVTTDRAATVRAQGDWEDAPTVMVNGSPATVTYADGVLSIPLAQGTSTLTIE